MPTRALKQYSRWIGYPITVFFAFIVSAVLVNTATDIMLGNSESIVETLSKGVMIYIVTLFILTGVERIIERRRLTRRMLGIESLPTWTQIGYGVGGLILYLLGSMALITIVKQIVPGFDADQAQELGFQAVYGIDRVLAFGLLVVVAPLVEEMIFRGYLYTKLRSAQMPMWLVIGIVSGCFAAAHGQWNVALDVFVLSVVACILRHRTGSIWPGVLLHMLKNLIAFYILFVVTAPSGL